MDPITRAIDDTVKAYGDRRRDELCRKTAPGYAAQFRNKLDPSQPNARMNVYEAVGFMMNTGDHRLLDTLAEEVGRTTISMPVIDAPSDMDLLRAWAEWQAEVAETTEAIKQSIEHDRMTTSHVASCRRELIEDLQKGLALLNVLDGMAEPDDNVTPLERREVSNG